MRWAEYILNMIGVIAQLYIFASKMKWYAIEAINLVDWDKQNDLISKIHDLFGIKFATETQTKQSFSAYQMDSAVENYHGFAEMQIITSAFMNFILWTKTEQIIIVDIMRNACGNLHLDMKWFSVFSVVRVKLFPLFQVKIMGHVHRAKTVTSRKMCHLLFLNHSPTFQIDDVWIMQAGFIASCMQNKKHFISASFSYCFVLSRKL